MSLIPKVNIGRKSGKNQFHVPCLTHGTSEIGYVLPSYSRNLINDASLSVSTRTAVRLSPLFVPTMGDLSVRHYHYFVPFNKLWTPFDAFLEHKPFTLPNGTTTTPKAIPHIIVGRLIRSIMKYCNYGTVDPNTFEFNRLQSDLSATVYYKMNSEDIYHLVDTRRWNSEEELDPQELQVAVTNLFGVQNPFSFNSYGNTYGGAPSFLIIPNSDGYSRHDIYGRITFDFSRSEVNLQTIARPGYQDAQHQYDDVLSPKEDEFYHNLESLSVPTLDNCDFSLRISAPDLNCTFVVCYNYNGAWKRLRSIFLGLGYAFNPWDITLKVSPLKLLAFYRAYWHAFGVNRNVNFQDTYCCKITRYISNLENQEINPFDNDNHLVDFCVQELINCTYTTPSDYFSSSVTDTNNGLIGTGQIDIKSEIGNTLMPDNVSATARAGSAGLPPSSSMFYAGSQDLVPSVGIQMALKLLRWVNRYTVVGSKIYDGLRARYGNIDVNDESDEGVIKVGDSSTEIEIGAIFNQSDLIETSGAPLGSYAGVGTGRGGSDKVTFSAPSFGCFITLTAVVPQMGYFQGALRENSDGVGDAFEMFDPTFDAVGWQTVRYNELIADRSFQVDGDEIKGTELGVFGYQPRYTHMKCGFNRCIGDISLPHMQDSMLPYTLDRFFPQRSPSLPVNSPQWFRSATRGETNRIFQVTSSTDDHVIWQIYFDVDMYASMKSISDSYDTHLPEDDNTIEVSHE